MPVFVKVGIAQMEMANFEFFKKISHTAWNQNFKSYLKKEKKTTAQYSSQLINKISNPD